MENKTLVRFNVQNIKYATRGNEGTFGTPKPYGTALKMALEADTSTKKIFGDGRRICSIKKYLLRRIETVKFLLCRGLLHLCKNASSIIFRIRLFEKHIFRIFICS